MRDDKQTKPPEVDLSGPVTYADLATILSGMMKNGVPSDGGKVWAFDMEPSLTRADLEKLERQLIPLLNTIRKLLGKGPVAPWN